ncbi:NAD(P)/FAD-dependent oxidoreductase [Nesterenkonia sp. F]|uniref:NAD(P)/FAD-dependent oxidoreductase n=1 Tax=Nesterenkonia sp. F TaxID=795955 RepID=UPI000255DB56|nr:NAD(P)/FAD-dependent oxidoreductase [Nesterenkonia sp. F]
MNTSSPASSAVPTPHTSADHDAVAPSRLHDVIVLGGGAAGLSAAVALGRARRDTLVLDTGAPRNRFAAGMHAVLGHEGLDPADLLGRGRAEAAAYGVSFAEAGAVEVVESAPAADDSPDAAAPRPLHVTDTTGVVRRARAVVVATGVSDRLPEIPGLAEHWGTAVLHCPYCHGWEVGDARLGVLAAGPMSLHQAELIRQWSDRLTFFSAAAEPLEQQTLDRLAVRDVVVEPSAVVEVVGDGERLHHVELADGRQVALDALFTAGELIPHDGFLDALDLERADTPVGRFLAVDQGGRTSHGRIFAAGNVAQPMANVPTAMSTGTMAGAMANMTLVTEDFDRAERHRRGPTQDAVRDRF